MRPRLQQGTTGRYAFETRVLRGDGSTLWCSVVITPLRDQARRPNGFVSIVQDIGERKRQMERAARIQRQLLPQRTPELEGYELAGTCLPAEEVAGDYYDWVASGGNLDLTVADVMGKGIAAALVMATLRAAMRAAPPDLGPADRLRIAADCMDLGLDEEGLFVTLFHARLDVASGVLRYVDAGHGYCVIRRLDGELVDLPERSLPLGAPGEEVWREGTIRLEPGDTLVVYSDGLVEREERTLEFSAFTADIDTSADAAEMVGRLLARMPAHGSDDVTVVVLRRRLSLAGRRGRRGGGAGRSRRAPPASIRAYGPSCRPGGAGPSGSCP